ncbi:MAG: GNAT family N-acetyltransferase, partial [Candidatus Daviesbacteria bacterium]|nr:GNAT family N-acetyltransferase [Candidatus Daviesbacteria bacterium]
PVADFKTEKELVSQVIKLNPYSNFIAIKEGKIIGTVFGAFNGWRGWVYHLAIDPFFQKKGLGSLLLQKAEQALKKAGAKRVLLGVKKLNGKALAFYKKQGYIKVNDAIWMGKDLI